MKLCSVDGCTLKHKGLTYCRKHYVRFKTHGDPLKARSYTGGMSVREKLDFYTIRKDGCWSWTGAKDSNGYGILRIKGKGEGAHRLSWETKNGKITGGLFVLHKCDNPECTNPNHLFLGTQQDNVRDRDNKGRGCIPVGVLNGMAKLNDKLVIEILARLKKGERPYHLAKEYKLHHSTVADIRDKRTWKHL